MKSVCIPVFENQTMKYGLEDILTKSIIDAFIQDNRLKVVERKVADSILWGEIKEYSREPFAYDELANVKDYKSELTLKLTYKDKSGKTLLEKEFNGWLLYESDSPEEDAIENLCSKLANDILKRILEGW